MVRKKVSSKQTLGHKYGLAALAMVALSSATLPVLAGSQSLLDPYATVQPTPGDVQPLGERTSSKKPKVAKTVKKRAVANPAAANPAAVASTINSANINPGFFSGMKEIQHGTMTSFKAAGRGIINGSKSAGAKIASAGGSVKNGINNAGHKIFKPKAIAANPNQPNKKTKNASINNNTLAYAPDSPRPKLPGKPLTPSRRNFLGLGKPKTKSKPLAISKAKPHKKNVVSRTFDKINVFSKHKNAPAINSIAANNPNGVTK